MDTNIYYLGIINNRFILEISNDNLDTYSKQFLKNNRDIIFEFYIKFDRKEILKKYNVYKIVKKIKCFDDNFGDEIYIKDDQIYNPKIENDIINFNNFTLFIPIDKYNNIKKHNNFIISLKQSTSKIDKLLTYICEKYNENIDNLDKISTKLYICEWCENKKKGSEMITCGECNRTLCDDCRFGDDVTPEGINCCELNNINDDKKINDLIKE
jgi:hypothetical protein